MFSTPPSLCHNYTSLCGASCVSNNIIRNLEVIKLSALTAILDKTHANLTKNEKRFTCQKTE